MTEPRYAIKRSDDTYYQGTVDARPVFGAGHKATYLDQEMAEKRLLGLEKDSKYTYEVVPARSGA